MMKAFNPILNTLLVLACSVAVSLAGGKGWLSDLDVGLAKAKKEGKPLLASFTGSDWCAPCIMMEQKVFSKGEFVSKASKDYILVVVDSPNRDKALEAKNEKYFIRYGVEGVPSVVLFKPDGKKYDTITPVDYPSVRKFLKRIRK